MFENGHLVFKASGRFCLPTKRSPPLNKVTFYSALVDDARLAAGTIETDTDDQSPPKSVVQGLAFMGQAIKLK